MPLVPPGRLVDEFELLHMIRRDHADFLPSTPIVKVRYQDDGRSHEILVSVDALRGLLRRVDEAIGEGG